MPASDTRVVYWEGAEWDSARKWLTNRSLLPGYSSRLVKVCLPSPTSFPPSSEALWKAALTPSHFLSVFYRPPSILRSRFPNFCFWCSLFSASTWNQLTAVIRGWGNEFVNDIGVGGRRRHLQHEVEKFWTVIDPNHFVCFISSKYTFALVPLFSRSVMISCYVFYISPSAKLRITLWSRSRPVNHSPRVRHTYVDE